MLEKTILGCYLYTFFEAFFFCSFSLFVFLQLHCYHHFCIFILSYFFSSWLVNSISLYLFNLFFFSKCMYLYIAPFSLSSSFFFCRHIFLATHHSFKIQLFQVDLIFCSLFISSCLSFSIMDFWLFSIFFFLQKKSYLFSSSPVVSFVPCYILCKNLSSYTQLFLTYFISLMMQGFNSLVGLCHPATPFFFFGYHFSTHSLGSTTYLL